MPTSSICLKYNYNILLCWPEPTGIIFTCAGQHHDFSQNLLYILTNTIKVSTGQQMTGSMRLGVLSAMFPQKWTKGPLHMITFPFLVLITEQHVITFHIGAVQRPHEYGN